MWWDDFGPSAVWAKRYRGGCEAADRFLRESERKRDLEREREREREARERTELEARNASIRRRLRRTVVAAVAALSLALIAVGQWRRAEGASRRAESSEHAAWALAVLRTDPEQSLRRAIQAVEAATTTTSASALREVLAASVIRKLWSVPLRACLGGGLQPRRPAAGGGLHDG